jgi:hypothetical protein
MAGHVNIHFRCTVLDCGCGEVIVPAQVVTRVDGTVMYEYTNRCPKCSHKLSVHQMTDQPVTPRRTR